MFVGCDRQTQSPHDFLSPLYIQIHGNYAYIYIYVYFSIFVVSLNYVRGTDTHLHLSRTTHRYI